MAREDDNFDRWRRSDDARRWVAARGGRWSHDDWLGLLDALSRSSSWPMREADIGGALEAARAGLSRTPDADPDRPISAVGSAVLHLAANDDAFAEGVLRRFVLDPDDGLAERWQLLQTAERDAWKAVELLLFKKGVERRFRGGELDAWKKQTPYGGDIRRSIEDFYEHYGRLELPNEPRSFTMLAFLELRSARLCGLVHAECNMPGMAMANLSREVGGQYPNLARLVRHPGLDIAGMAVEFLGHRLNVNDEMRRQFAGVRFGDMAQPRTGVIHLATAFVKAAEVVEEFIGDLLAEVTFKDRTRRQETLEKVRLPLTLQEDAETEREARAELKKTLGQRRP